MKGLMIELSNGHFDIVSGSGFAVESGTMPLLCYEENGIMHIKTDPQDGALGEARIAIPKASENVRILLKRASASICAVNTGIFEAKLTESSAEFISVKARRIRLFSGKSDTVIRAEPLVAAEFRCGFGSLKIFMGKNGRGYSYDMMRGEGTIALNSNELQRTYKGGTPGGVPVQVICGLGTVEIHNN